MKQALRLTALAGVAIVVSCSDHPSAPQPTEPPRALRLTAPAESVEGEPFALIVDALNDSGEIDTHWTGDVKLTASTGAISPSTLVLSAGTATAQVTLTGTAGASTLTATAGDGGSPVSAQATLFVLSAQEPARLVVEPSSFLLTAPGEEASLQVRAYDASGQQTSVPNDLTWRSLDAGIIAVAGGAGGGVGTVEVAVATAVAASGSAQVVAETPNGLSSNAALGLVATPAAGAVLVADSQVIGGLDPVDVDAPFVPGFQYRVRVTGTVEVAPGELVIGAGEAPVAGRVVAVTSDGSDQVLTLELVPLAELFTELVIDEQFQLIDAEDAPGARFGLATGAGGSAPGAGPARLPGLSGLSGLSSSTEFTVGPFKCKASGSVPGLELGEPDYEITPSLELTLDYDGGLRALTVTGQVEATFEYKPRLNVVFSGDVGCTRVIRTLVIPVGGFLSLLVGAQVPIGVGVDLNAKLEVAEVGFDVDASANATVSLGMTCPASGGTCTGLSSADGSADARFEFVAPDPSDQFKLTLGAHGYAFARLTLGSPLSSAWQWKAFQAKAGLEQTVDLATAHKQAEDTAYASGFWLVAKANAGPDSDLTTAVEWLEQRLGLALDVSALEVETQDTLARSPTGTFEITPKSVAAGDSTALGDKATFKATLEEVSYLSSKTVDKMEFLWWKEAEDENGQGTGEFTLEPGRPGCTDIQAGAGQTEFTCETDFLEEHRGTQTFFAFAHAELFGVPLPVPLEIAPHGADEVRVGDCIGWDNFAPQFYVQHDTTSDGRGSTYTSSAEPVTHGEVGATINATSEKGESGTPRFSLTVFAYDFLCVRSADTANTADTLFVRFRITGQVSVDPPNSEWGSSSATARFGAGQTLVSWLVQSQLKEDPLSIDEEIVVPMLPGYWNLLRGEAYVWAGSSNGFPHGASSRLKYELLRVENSSGTELTEVSIETRSGTDYGQGSGDAARQPEPKR